MSLISKHLQGLNERYLGPEGDRLAEEELLPVVRRFLPQGGKILEVGCGYGRNLVALSSLRETQVVGCDVDAEELAKARKRLAPLSEERRNRVTLVQQESNHLPFPEKSFDLVVLWQVLEHVFGKKEKQELLNECARVLRSGGYLLVETPNLWFPFDYHDNKLPFVHWVFSRGVRQWLTRLVRKEDYPASEYGSLPFYTRMLKRAPGVVRVTKVTRVYFSPSYWFAWRRLRGTQIAVKRVIFALAAPLHLLLSLVGLSADLVLPSLRVVWRVEKR